MAYPPSVPSGARINTTPQVDLHPADHLEIHAALTDIVTVLGSDPAGDAADVTARFALEMPVGVILPYGGSSAPSGWALCDGTPVSRATYATLFGIIDTAFGAGDGVNTFNLPDLQNRYPIGDSSTLTLGASVGSNDSVLIQHQHSDTLASPAHTHSTPAHSHEVDARIGFTSGWTIGSGSELQRGIENSGVNNVNTTSGGGGTSGPASATALTGSVGNVSGATTGSATNTNRPASVVVNYIIRLT